MREGGRRCKAAFFARQRKPGLMLSTQQAECRTGSAQTGNGRDGPVVTAVAPVVDLRGNLTTIFLLFSSKNCADLHFACINH